MLEPLLDALGFDRHELWPESASTRRSLRRADLERTLQRRCRNLVRRRRLIEALRLRVEQDERRARRLSDLCRPPSSASAADHQDRLREIDVVRSALARHHVRLARQERRYQQALAQVRRIRQELASWSITPTP
jgi:hypothetical protein